MVTNKVCSIIYSATGSQTFPYFLMTVELSVKCPYLRPQAECIPRFRKLLRTLPNRATQAEQFVLGNVNLPLRLRVRGAISKGGFVLRLLGSRPSCWGCCTRGYAFLYSSGKSQGLRTYEFSGLSRRVMALQSYVLPAIPSHEARISGRWRLSIHLWNK